MYAIAFDVDTETLQRTYGAPASRHAYADIRRILDDEGFAWVQGSVNFGLPERVDAVAYLDRFMSFMERFYNGQSYQNYPRLSQTDYRRRYWGRFFDDLLAVKRKYDKKGFFRSAQGISADPCRPQVEPVSALPGLLDRIESESDPL